MTTALAQLPRLGVGISAEPGSAVAGIDALAFAADHPGLVHFLEYGSDLDRGLDDHVRRWAAAGRADHLSLPRSEPRGSRRRRRRLAARHRRRGARHRRRLAVRRRRAVALRRARSRPPDAAAADPDARLRRRLRRVDRAHRSGHAACACCRRTRPARSTWASCTSSTTSRASAIARGCGLLLDCAHLAMFQRLRGLPPTAGARRLPARSRRRDPRRRRRARRRRRPGARRRRARPRAAARHLADRRGGAAARHVAARHRLRVREERARRGARQLPPPQSDVPARDGASARAAGDRPHALRSGASRRACAATRRRRCPSCRRRCGAQLAAIDPRALKLDRLLRRRTLRTLFDEYKASTTLYLARARKLAALDDFFRSPRVPRRHRHGAPARLRLRRLSRRRRARPSSARWPRRAA